MPRDRDEIQLGILKEGLRIDREALDQDVEQQAVLFYEAADLTALAASRRDEAKSLMDESYSAASDRIRRQAEKEGDRMTEPRIKELVNQDKTYVEAKTLYLKSKKKADDAANLKEAYDQRSKMLKELVSLFVAGYWSSASTSGTKRRVDADASARGRKAFEAQR